jgi:carotenoid 1,2-hydratase
VELDQPGWQWEGHGYFDANFGTRALEQDFRLWTWGRFPTRDGATCFYEARRSDGTSLEAGFRFGTDGSVCPAPMPPLARLPRSRWALRRETRADHGFKPRQVLPMLDAPFYCRSAVRTRIDGEETTGVHEALDLGRFGSPFLKPMIALRVPRRAKWRAAQSPAA